MAVNFYLQQYLEDNGFEVFVKKYDFPKIAKKLLKHAKKGGMINQKIIAGMLNITTQTCHVWRKEKEEFRELIEVAENIAATAIDEIHRQASVAEIDCNVILLHERHKKITKPRKPRIDLQKKAHENLQIVVDAFVDDVIDEKEFSALSQRILNNEEGNAIDFRCNVLLPDNKRIVDDSE